MPGVQEFIHGISQYINHQWLNSMGNCQGLAHGEWSSEIKLWVTLQEKNPRHTEVHAKIGGITECVAEKNKYIS